ncbi:hypothetical protein ONJ87_25565, partial [Salmonella enterica subsp. enterica serovar Anatum]|nr:hypothetical protein [Salmonella enterica subsp. enterica serovar Anatum]
LRIITNSLRVAHILYNNPRFEVMVPGGTLRPHNSGIIGPSAAEELKTLGIDGVMVYQETYHEAIYAQHHLKGKKQDFFWRLETPD